MTLPRRFHPEAGSELDAAVDWYGLQLFGLGEDLLELVEESANLVLKWPRIAPEFPGWDREPVVRSHGLERFPYQLIYYVTDSELMIVAFAHNSRKPGYWKDRI